MSCYYCERDLTATGGTRKTRDHVIPITRGGVNYKINIVLCCHDCNMLKAAKTLVQLVRQIEKAVTKNKKVSNYSQKQLKNIIKNSMSLLQNCVNVYQKQLFVDKYHWEDYKDISNYSFS